MAGDVKPPGSNGSEEWERDPAEKSRERVRPGPPPAYFGDRYFYRVVGWGLVGIVGIAMGGLIWLAACEKEIPDAIVAMGSAAIGALASVLTVNRH